MTDYRKKLKDLTAVFDHKKSIYIKKCSERDIYLQQKNALQDTRRCEELEIEKLEKVVILLKKTSEYAREQTKQQIERLVTNCLRFVFENEVSFEIEFRETKTNMADFYVIDKYGDYYVKTDPETSRGGGIVDIVALALRIAFIQTGQPISDGPIILDEPAKHVSNEYIDKVSEFIKKLSESFHRQVIMVTHSQNLSAIGDRSFRIEKKDSGSQVTLLE